MSPARLPTAGFRRESLRYAVGDQLAESAPGDCVHKRHIEDFEDPRGQATLCDLTKWDLSPQQVKWLYPNTVQHVAESP